MRASISSGLTAHWLQERGHRLKKDCQGQDPEDSKEHSTLSVSLGFEKTTDRWLYLGVLTDNTTFPEAKEQAVSSHVTRDHQNQSRRLSPKGGTVNFFKNSPLFPIVPFMLCFWQTSVLFQQDEERSMVILNVFKCLLEICHSFWETGCSKERFIKYMYFGLE